MTVFKALFPTEQTWRTGTTVPYGVGWYSIVESVYSLEGKQVISKYRRPMTEDEWAEHEAIRRVNADREECERQRLEQVSDYLDCSKCGEPMGYTDDYGDGNGCVFVCFKCKPKGEPQ